MLESWESYHRRARGALILKVQLKLLRSKARVTRAAHISSFIHSGFAQFFGLCSTFVIVARVLYYVVLELAIVVSYRCLISGVDYVS